MGLDMYLTKKIYVGAEYEHRNVKAVVDITVGEKKLNIDVTKISQIEERAGYWRKANHIHKWFVDNVQNGEDNCEEHYVSKDDMKKLLDICKVILKDNSKAPELMPTQSGFFFGGTEYDSYYFQDLKDTKKILEKCLKDAGEIDVEYYYRSSW